MNNYMGIEGVTNKDPGPHYVNWIELLSWSLGNTRGTMGSTRDFQHLSEIHITISGNSPYLQTLMQAAVNGKSFHAVDIVTFSDHAPDPNHPGELMKTRMEDVIFVTPQLSGGDNSTATFTLNYARKFTDFRVAPTPEEDPMFPQSSRWRTPGVQ